MTGSPRITAESSDSTGTTGGAGAAIAAATRLAATSTARGSGYSAVGFNIHFHLRGAVERNLAGRNQRDVAALAARPVRSTGPAGCADARCIIAAVSTVLPEPSIAATCKYLVNLYTAARRNRCRSRYRSAGTTCTTGPPVASFDLGRWLG